MIDEKMWDDLKTAVLTARNDESRKSAMEALEAYTMSEPDPAFGYAPERVIQGILRVWGDNTQRILRNRILDYLDALGVSSPVPSRYSATPVELDAYLSTILCEDTKLRLYQWVGEHAVREAVADGRLAAERCLKENEERDLLEYFDEIDPAKGPVAYPSQLPKVAD